MALGVALLCVLAWQLVVVPRLDPPPLQIDMWRERLVWLGPGRGPFFSREDIPDSQLLVVGDSRVRAGVEAELFDDAGLGPTAVVWGTGARLAELLPAVRRLSPRRLLVALSAVGLNDKVDLLARAVLQEPPPEFSPEQLPDGPLRWSDAWRDELVSRDWPRDRVDRQLAQFRQAFERETLHDRLVPRALDVRLGHFAHELRRELVRPIAPEAWGERWIPQQDRRGDLDKYPGWLALTSPGARAQNLDQVKGSLAGLIDDGWRLACVRLPIAAELLAIEDGVLAPGTFEGLCAELGIPYFDHSEDPYPSHDGSHLTREAGRRFSRTMAAELRRLDGW